MANLSQALSPDSTPLWDKAESNVVYDWTDTYGDPDAVFAKADRIITERFSCQRQSNQPMETRGTVVDFDEAGDMIIHSSTQSSHLLRWMAAGLTEKTSTLSALKSFISNKEKRTAFFAAAKDFMQQNKESLDKQDNSGAADQFKKDKSFPLQMARIGMGLLGREDMPTAEGTRHRWRLWSQGWRAPRGHRVIVAAQHLGRPVKWIEDRVENLVDGGHAREEDMTVSIAIDDDGTFRGMKVDMVMDQGAYPAFPVGGAFTTRIMKVMFPGSYKWDAYELRSRLVSTNKGKYVAYRGPWANETWVRERIIDVAARALRMSPTELRLKNMIGEADMPTTMITGPTIDETMSTRKTLERALEVVDLEAFEVDRAKAAAEGRHLGIGFACYHEAAPGPPNYFDCISPGTDMLGTEVARSSVEPDGSIVVYTSQMPHGQSHETTYAQVAADEFGVGIEDIKLVWGNTERTPFSVLGTGGSRGGPLGGGSIRGASREVRQKINQHAAQMLEASPDDIEITDGNIHVAGVPSKGISYSDVAASVGVSEDDPQSAFSASIWLHRQRRRRLVLCHPCLHRRGRPRNRHGEDPPLRGGRGLRPIINPAIVDGQVRGGVAQGIGAVLYENSAFDADGNPQATTYMDYLLPTAVEIPDIECHHIETLSPGRE